MTVKPPRRRLFCLAAYGALAGSAAISWRPSANAADQATAHAGSDLLERPASATNRGARRLLLDICVAGPRITAVGEAGLLLASDDDGQTWQQLASPTSVMLTALHFVDASHGWAVGHDGVVLSTTDGGEAWQRCFDGSQANTAMLAAAEAGLTAVDALTKLPEEQIERIRDRALDNLAAAKDAMKAGPSRPLLTVRFLNRREGWVAGSFGQLFATADGGLNWRYVGDRLDNPEGLHLNGLLIGQDRQLHIAAEAGVVFSSTDGGNVWHRGETGYLGHLYGVLETGPSQLLAYGFNGHLYRSANNGTAWHAVKSPSRKTLVGGVHLGETNILLLAEDGRLFASRDEAGSFELLPMRLKPRRHTAFVAKDGWLVAVGAGGVSRHELPQGLR